MKYLYIPLGGNRKGKMRQSCNLLITMMIGGLWHGAGWKFILWGLIHGGALVVHKQFFQLKSSFGRCFKNKWLHRVFLLISVITTNIFIAFTWVIFRSETLSEAWIICQRMMQLASGVKYYFVFTFIYGFIVFIAYFVGIFFNHGNGFYIVMDLRKFIPCFCFAFVFLLTLGIFYAGNTAFIYQKF